MADEIVECPKCHYKATWRPATSDFLPALDMYPDKCMEITERVNNPQVGRKEPGADPRECRTFMREWSRVIMAKNREALLPKSK